MPKEIQKSNIADEVYKQMEEHILSWKWPPETKIPSENELVKMFNVSRNSVRSAIDKLKAIGILVSIQGKGTFVNEYTNNSFSDGFIPNVTLDNEEILEILEFRRTVEAEAAECAALRGSQEDIDRIEQAFGEMCSNLNDPNKYTMSDYKFHFSIAEASKNRVFLRVLYRLKDVLFSQLKETNVLFGSNAALERHGKILEAIKNRSPELARSLVAEHLNVSINDMKHRIYLSNNE